MVDLPDPANVELLDLGSGDGSSLENACQRFGIPQDRAMGIELDPDEVAAAHAADRPVREGSILDLDPAEFPNVRVVMLDNVLEHLFTMEDVQRAVWLACRVASDVIHVRHPSFEDSDYLNDLGLKQYWTDWEEHRVPLRLAELAHLFERNGWYGLVIRPVKRALDSADDTMIPLDAPRDSEHYDEALHGPKPEVTFDRPVWYAYDVVATPVEAATLAYPGDTETSDQRPVIEVVPGRELVGARRRVDELEQVAEEGQWARRQVPNLKEKIDELNRELTSARSEAGWSRRQLERMQKDLEQSKAEAARSREQATRLRNDLKAIQNRKVVKLANKLGALARKAKARATNRAG